MPEQDLINKIRELKQELKELDAQITTKERGLYRNYGDQNEAERLKNSKELDDLKRKKDEKEKEKSHLQEKVQLQARIETKEKKLQAYTNQIKDLKKSNEQFFKEITVLQRKINDLNLEIQKLKKMVEERDNRVRSLEEKIEQNELNHKKTIECIGADHEKEIKDLIYECKTEIEKQSTTHLKELDEYLESNIFLDYQVQGLNAKNLEMQNAIKESKKYASYCTQENKHIIYFMQICSDLQNNLYRYVIPKRCHVKNRTYKVKNIEEDISEDLLSEEEQIEAKRRWKEVQSQINWNTREKKSHLLQAMKRLQYDRNEAAHPKALSKEGAEIAANELKKQGKLDIKPSYDDALKAINLWVSYKSRSDLL